jgi:hypothetical protein
VPWVDYEGWVVQQRGEVALTPVVQIYVQTAVVVEQKVSQRVDPLDWIAVGVVGGQEPGVVGG